jgi:hypothetical protein
VRVIEVEEKGARGLGSLGMAQICYFESMNNIFKLGDFPSKNGDLAERKCTSIGG